MASQLQFEGPVLEDLLERVRAEVGSDARIVAANRVRKGGVGGFFARQAFEVLVEPANPAIAPTASTTPDATPVSRPEGRFPATILELADAVSEHERNDIIDLVEERSLSTASPGFAEVLDRVSRSIDATPDELVAADTGGRVQTDTEERGDHRGEIDLRVSTYSAISPPPATVPPSPLANEPTGPAPRPVDNDDLSGTPFGATPALRSERQLAPPADVIDRYETRLSRMGLPARLIPRGVGQHGLKGALVESLTRIPPAPRVPGGLGVVIATVGVGASPVLLGRELASEIGLDPDDVMLATRELLGGGVPAWLQMCDAETARERRMSWRRRTRPTIVACSLPPAARGLRWACEILDNLEPTITWAIVDAGWKREDIAHRVEELGGVDVLALDDLDGTVSPASALELGIPVGRLEHEYASPLTWTELLLERMSS